MQDSNSPTKIPLAFAASAAAPYINSIPTASQIGITNGAASFTDGFPPLTFVPIASGGAGPFGKDFNGLLNQMTAGIQWFQAGGPIFYDPTFSSAIGGYPKGAIVANATVLGLSWISTIDNNTSDPDTGGAGWLGLSNRQTPTAATTYFVDFSAGNDSTGDGTAALPWKTVQKAWNYIFANIDAGGQTITIQQNGSGAGFVDSTGLVANGGIPGCAVLHLILNGGLSVTGSAIVGTAGASISLAGAATIIGTVNDVVSSNGAAVNILGGQILGACSGSRLYSEAGGLINIVGNYTSVGNAGAEWTADKNGVIAVADTSVITLSGTVGYSVAFAHAATNGVISADRLLTTFVGSATGDRFLADTGGGIFTNAATAASYFPGNIAGTPAVGTLGTLGGWTDQV